MPEFGEDLLQFVWKHRRFKPVPLFTQSGKSLSILHPGELNKDAGPDFFNARLVIDGIELAGNVEIHLRSSDWSKHGHEQDRRYDRIILHAVYDQDKEIAQNSAHGVEVLLLKNYLNSDLISRFDDYHFRGESIPCSSSLHRCEDEAFRGWLETMSQERLRAKTAQAADYYERSGRDYSRTLYALLLRSFGFKVNGEAFGLLAYSLPFQLLARHADNACQTEALLLGMAGMLEGEFHHDYIRKISDEFKFLKAKYNLSPLNKEVFRMSKMRPANFPSLRLVQFARLIHRESTFLNDPVNFSDFQGLRARLSSIQPGDYWKNHYLAEGKFTGTDIRFGMRSAESLIINGFAPFLEFYGKRTGKKEFSIAAGKLLQSCVFERNYKTRFFERKKSLLKNASQSQGLIHLYDQFCLRKKCLKCGVAAAILSQK
jgi:hypothetical protein